MTTKSNEKQLLNETFASKPETVEQVEAVTDKISRAMNFSEQERDNIAIAITEAVNNAIYHGNKLDINKKIHYTIYSSGDSLRFLIRDEGKGFKPSDVPDPLEPANLLKENGRGIFILKSLMDDVYFDFSPHGTTITLIKTKKKEQD
ncbi:MAG: ATP-binding protein [Deferribacteres bacterium]|nr:ATP-binding protein [candidate division KSB1 bacterium]MCB9502498.1 ATP-binding protein [Deferribacteres bacterium]